ncbi:unnamed protein product [Periconia digitata]|uniref:Transcription factor IIIC subunit delta N-term-domain-containing protein n=1 Tax=Periconia digitata TaxID=1303443 RepID=A0A9W4UHS8_9PLEO|nr:unnamed protein product [Periconia digitata]
MSDATNVNVWPCTTEAVDWSFDGIIALAADDSVELLFPNSDSSDTEQKAASWQHAPLQVSWFTSTELPEKEPAPIPIYSVGEELSTSSPLDIAWSPPGLAKHRRCALSVLTSGLALSIWSAEGDPRKSSSWKRRLVVNNALRSYFDKDAILNDSVVASQTGEKEKINEYDRLRTRVRSSTWAPALPNAEYTGVVGTESKWAQHMIAVTNEDNQVAIVIVESPTSTFGSEEWNAEVLDHFTVMPDSESIFTVPGTFDDIMGQQRCISHMAWSPWKIQGQWYHSIIAYATNNDVRLRIITYTPDTIGLGDEVLCPDLCLRHKGPMKWSPRIKDGDKLTLALFGIEGLTVLTVSMSDATILERKTHGLDGRWDKVSGVIWDDADSTPTRLHFSSLHSTMSSPTAGVEISSGGLIELPSPSWREQISDTQALFSAQNDLKGNAKSKVWGLCISPLRDFIAFCHTVHPSDMLEYGPPRDRNCHVALSSTTSYKKDRLPFPANNVSAEGIAFTLRKCLENTVENADQVPEFTKEVLDAMLRTYRPKQGGSNSDHGENYNTGDIAELTTSFKHDVFLEANMLKDRYTILINQTCSVKTPTTLPRALIAFRLAKAIVNMIPRSLAHSSSFSREILMSHHQVICLINAVTNQNDSTAPSTSITTMPNQSTPDSCDFCDAAIPFTDLEIATCLNGHQYPRCGLSFIAIQAPRISKFCGLCKTGFFSEEFVTAQEVTRNSDSDDLGDVETQTLGQSAANEDIEMPDVRHGEDQTSGPDEANHLAAKNLATETREQPDKDIEALIGPGKQDIITEGLPVSLARVLFLACDVCIYCGGKFLE